MGLKHITHMLTHQGRVADSRLVATSKKLAAGRIVQRQVLTTTVGHSETDFLGRSSDLDRSSGNGVAVYETGLGFVMRPRRDTIQYDTILYLVHVPESWIYRYRMEPKIKTEKQGQN